MNNRNAAYCLVLSVALVACSPQTPAPAQKTSVDSTATEDALDQVRESVRASRGPAGGDVVMSLAGAQFPVSIINRPLNDGDHSARNVEATRIANAIAISTTGKPQVAAATGIHINFVARPADGGKERLVDAIDFRKDPSGHFTLHVT